MTLELRRKNRSTEFVDLRGMDWNSFAVCSPSEASRFPIRFQGQEVAFSELFDITTRPFHPTDASLAPPNLLLMGDFSQVTGIGARLQQATIAIYGNAGDHLGDSLSGGSIWLMGDCGDDAAQGMQGGCLFIDGNCGDRLAGSPFGRRIGMSGGDIFIRGNVGDRPAERMRRGTIYVHGASGTYGCFEMVAGTYIAGGGIGNSWCRGMKRGTLILSKTENALESYRLSPSRVQELNFLPLLWKHLQRLQESILRSLVQWNLPSPTPVNIPTTRWVKRSLVEIPSDGRGEVLVFS